MTRVKLCGLMNRDDIAMAVDAGADALGFVTEYPADVPWNLSREAAAELIASVPPFVTTTAVVGGSVEEMVARALYVKPHFLQLHGDETLEEIASVCECLAPTGIKVLKALRIDIETGDARFSEKDPLQACHLLARSGVAGLVVDSMTPHRPAGTGVPLDWRVIRTIAGQLELPLILAGGLNAGNVGEAIRQVHPYAVDVISGIEKQAGVKDARLMADFVRAVKHHG